MSDDTNERPPLPERELPDWIAVDLDGTLAVWETWVAWNHIGPPIPKMVERIRRWLREGAVVKIFTARVAFDEDICKATGARFTRAEMQQEIGEWTLRHIGTALESTAIKDFACQEIWDDKAIGMVPNTGYTLTDEMEAELNALRGKP